MDYLKVVGSNINICKDPKAKDFFDCISDIIFDEKVLEMKKYYHHFDITCYQHCLNVSFYNFKVCKALKLDAKAAARGGLLHDLFLYDWHQKHIKGEPWHAFVHGRKALENAKKICKLSKKEENMILSHMFPISYDLPKYKESFVISFVDKYCAIAECFARLKKKFAIKKD